MCLARYRVFACLSAGLWLVSGASIAAESWHTSTLKAVYPHADGMFVLIFDTSATDCASPNNYHYVAPMQNGVTDEGAKRIYAAALSALAMDKTVQVNFDNATSACYVNRLVVLK